MRFLYIALLLFLSGVLGVLALSPSSSSVRAGEPPHSGDPPGEVPGDRVSYRYFCEGQSSQCGQTCVYLYCADCGTCQQCHTHSDCDICGERCRER